MLRRERSHPLLDVGGVVPPLLGDHPDVPRADPVDVGRGVRVDRRERVLLVDVVSRRFQVPAQRSVERRTALAHRLDRDLLRLEDGSRRGRGDPVGGAIDVEPIGCGGDVTVVEQDAVGLDAADASAAHDALDVSELLELGRVHGRHAVHRRRDRRVDPPQQPGVLQAFEEVGDGRRLGGHLDSSRPVDDEAADLVARLQRRPVDDPCVAGLDPRDAVRIDAVVEQPVARVHAGLAGTDHHIAARRLLGADEVVDGHESHAVVDFEARRVRRRDRALEEACVDDLPSHDDVARGAGEQRVARARPRSSHVQSVIPRNSTWPEGAAGRAGPPGSSDRSRRRLRVRRSLRRARNRRCGPRRGRASSRRRTPRLMEPDERVRVVPVPAGGMTPVDHEHRRG